MDDFFVTDFDEIRKEQERKLEELSKNPPSDIDFTYSKEDLDRIISDFRSELERKKNEIKSSNGSGVPIDDYTEEWEYHYEPTPSDIIDLVDSFNKLDDKNNIGNVEYIVSQINQKYNDRMQLPNEITKTMEEIKEHLDWLHQIRDINQYLNSKQVEQQKVEQMQSDQLGQQEQQIQQERFKTIQDELQHINEIIDFIKNNEVYKSKENEILKERLYFYHKVNISAEDILNGRKEITQEDMDRLNSFIETLDSMQNEMINSQQTTPVQEETNAISTQTEINQLKEQIEKYNNQINKLLANMHPYMQIPKVNQEISKVIDKNNEINSSQIMNGLNDYKTIVETKQSILTYLEQADKFIKDNVGKQQEPVASVQQPVQLENTQSLPDDFWKEFEQPQQEQIPQQPLPENFWDEFDKPTNDHNARPERRYNDDGTFTMEYITHLATTPLGFNKDIYYQLLQENEAKRQQFEEQMTSGGLHM